MKRFFYWLVVVAVLVAFYQSDLADDLLKGNEVGVGNWFNKLSDAAEQKVLRDFREEAKPLLAELSENQLKYTEHVMKDRETLGVFYLRYCKGDDINPYIYGNTREKFCEQIQEAGILRNHR
ncbi:hypothetical protein DRW07_14370 [Alteromonas sediminis]|uniref:Uncharacterized protein n=1 Tax=Alteromonas sediminis TaxID=2259342 RepID=A0A3N5Z9L6_9ALTE|nr:hypothetical protein [Alteromonas sediminis]RPJ65988.1 hypothetical protein DRW07_14370 [Alteromonas sediminis]